MPHINHQLLWHTQAFATQHHLPPHAQPQVAANTTTKTVHEHPQCSTTRIAEWLCATLIMTVCLTHQIARRTNTRHTRARTRFAIAFLTAITRTTHRRKQDCRARCINVDRLRRRSRASAPETRVPGVSPHCLRPSIGQSHFERYRAPAFAIDYATHINDTVAAAICALISPI